jgi:hypothetical protein
MTPLVAAAIGFGEPGLFRQPRLTIGARSLPQAPLQARLGIGAGQPPPNPGTEGSNLASSSGESPANLRVFAADKDTANRDAAAAKARRSEPRQRVPGPQASSPSEPK